MINILGLWLFLLIIIPIHWFLIPQRRRGLFLLAISLFLSALVSLKYTCYFLFNIAIVYIGGIILSKEVRNRKNLLKLILFWLIGNLCFFKYVNILLDVIFKVGLRFSLTQKEGFLKILLPLGISYIFFRLIHYIVEVYRKNVPKSSFVDLALYILFFPTFLAGPVERFQRFQPQTAEQKEVDISDINYGLFRIILGMVKKFIIADNLGRFIMPVFYFPQDYTRVFIILCIYALAVRIYLDFSGYTDIAVGVARFFGYKIMENFNRPFFKKNIALFWRSWHISVYSWIRDYFFFPLFGYRASRTKIYIGIFSTMMVFMLWHRGNINFLILGIYYGLGLILWHIFQEIKRKFPLIHNLSARPYLNPVSTFLTFSFVSFGFIIFSLEMENVYNVLHRIF